MDTKIVQRVVIIGGGAMGLEHIRNIKLIPNALVVAVVDSNSEARKESKRLVNEECLIYSSITELDPTTFDAIILATPNYSHIDVIRTVMKWKKHMLVEKPLCTTMKDCLEVKALLAEYAPNNEFVFWVGMEYRFMPPIAKLLDVVDSGDLGSLHMVHIREHRFPFLLKVDDWNRFSKFTGGTLVEKCCHFWDLMRRIVGPGGEAVRVFASGGMDVNHKDEVYSIGSATDQDVQAKPDIVDNAFVVVEFSNGVRCCLDLCMFAEDRQHEEVSVVGSLGKVHAEAPACVVTHHTPTQRASGATASKPRVPPAPGTYEANTVVTPTHVDPELLEAGFHEGATFFELKAFFQAMEDGSAALVSVDDGMASVAIGIAAELSIKEKRLVHMSEIVNQDEPSSATKKQKC